MSFGIGAQVAAMRDSAMEKLLGTTTNEASSASTPTTTQTDAATDSSATEQVASTSSTTSPAAGAEATATTETPVVKSGEAQPQSSESANQTEAAQVAAAVQSDDVSSLPLHLQPRGKELVEQRKASDARAEAAEARVKVLEASKSGAEEAGTQTPAIPASQLSAQHEQAQQELATFQQQMGPARAAYIATLTEQMNDGTLTYAEADAQLAQADEGIAFRVEKAQVVIDRLSIDSERAQSFEAKRLDGLKVSLAPLLAKYPRAVPGIVETYVAAGYDPEATAKWSHDENSPIVDQAVSTATASVTTAKNSEIAALKAENERLNKLAGNIAAAPSAIRAGRGTAPARGSETPKATGKFGFLDIAMAKRSSSMGR